MSTNGTYEESCRCFGLCDTSTDRVTSQSSVPRQCVDPRLTNQSKEELDAILVQSISRLSFRQRQEEQADLHGVAEEISEGKDQVQQSLQELDGHLERLKKGTVYETAERADSAYVRNRNFRIMFLRGNRYDVEAAANQMIKFFGEKLKLFGLQLLTKDITINDLDEDDRAFLQSGTFQILRCFDRAKRPVVIEFPGLRSYKIISNELRARYYTYMSALKSESAQRRGLVVICYAVDQFRDTMHGAGFGQNAKLTRALPCHVSGLHACGSDQGQYIMGSAVISLIPATLRTRFKVHLGSHMECQYILSTYGIPWQAMPLYTATSNDVRLDYHLWWYQKCVELETKSSPPSSSSLMTLEPRPSDILYSGGGTSNNGGNQLLRLLVKRYSPSYNTSENDQKKHVVDQIMVEIMNNSKGRFLKKEDAFSPWEELPMDAVQEKIRQMFRNKRRCNRTAPEFGNPSFPLIATNLIDQVCLNDVVFGRLKRTSIGTDLMRQLVFDLAPEYDAANRGKKAEISEMIIERIKRAGGRFLVEAESGDNKWEEVSNDVARTKISRLFRNNRRSAASKKDI